MAEGSDDGPGPSDDGASALPAPAAHPAARALDRLTEGVFSVDRDGRVTFVNAALAAMDPRDTADLLGRPLDEIFPHLREGEFAEHLERALTLDEVTEYESFTPRIGRWLRRRFYPSDDGVTVLLGEGPSSVLSRDEDHELRQSLARAQEAERRYHDILDRMTEGVTETTPSGDFVVVNEAFAAMLGYDDAADLLAHIRNSAELYVDPADRDAALSRLQDGRVRTLELEMRRRDGRTVWVRARVTPRYTGAGQMRSLQALVEDITAERDADDRRREAEELVEARERRLLAEAVHDEPLQLVVAAILRLDGMTGRLPEELVDPVEHVMSLLDQTVEGLRDLLVALRPPDFTDGLGGVLSTLVEGLFRGTETAVRLQGGPHVPLTPETKLQAYRILREALFNVRKHASASEVVVAFEVLPRTVLLTVTDDGVGGARPEDEPGHLGLATMFARAENAGGTLQVDSPRGEGTRVVLTMPRRD